MAWTWDVLTQTDRNSIVDNMVKQVETQYWNLKIQKRRFQVRPLTAEFTQQVKDVMIQRINDQMAALEVEKAEIMAAKGGTTP